MYKLIIRCMEEHKWRMRKLEERKYYSFFINCFPYGMVEDIRG